MGDKGAGVPQQSGYYSARGSLLARASLATRTRVFDQFMRAFGDAPSVLDVGVTNERASVEANFFEKLYPHKDRITAAGVEDAAFLEQEHPGLRFKKIEAGQRLPFADDSFAVVFSHAVIEHVVGADQRRFFVDELLRVAPAVFVTTPNKRFPVEPHTFVPLLHMVSDRLFYALLDVRGGFYNRSNLDLLTRGEVRGLFAHRQDVELRVEAVRTFGFVSNWLAIARRPLRGSAR